MVYGRIYRAEFPNGKMYVGATTLALRVRVANHVNRAKQGESRCPALFNALRKYGEPEFTEIDVAFSQEDLDEKECFYIKHYDTFPPNGYNIRGGGSRGKISEETKRKISAKNKGRVVSEETKKKISISRKGKGRGSFSKERKHNMSLAQKGKPRNPESIAKMSATKKGVMPPASTMEKLQNAADPRAWISEEQFHRARRVWELKEKYPDYSHTEIGKLVGLSRSSAREILVGITFKEIYAENRNGR